MNVLVPVCLYLIVYLYLHIHTCVYLLVHEFMYLDVYERIACIIITVHILCNGMNFFRENYKEYSLAHLIDTLETY